MAMERQTGDKERKQAKKRPASRSPSRRKSSRKAPKRPKTASSRAGSRATPKQARCKMCLCYKKHCACFKVTHRIDKHQRKQGKVKGKK